MRRFVCVLLAAAACGGGEKPAADAHGTTTAATTGSGAGSATATATATAKKEPPHVIPGGCAGGSSDPCVPDATFVGRLCNGSFPDVALLLMSKSMPFTHAYLRGDVDGWNAEGGASARAKLKFDEEVLILEKRSGNTNGIQVSGTGGYQVMRWDGNCYTLSGEEVTMHRPPAPKFAPIAWRYLEDPTKNALLDDAKLKKAYDRRNHECKGAVSGDVTLSCQHADTALSAAVVAAVRGGASIPTPQHVP
jgi:hypothetical protein